MRPGLRVEGEIRIAIALLVWVLLVIATVAKIAWSEGDLRGWNRGFGSGWDAGVKYGKEVGARFPFLAEENP